MHKFTVGYAALNCETNNYNQFSKRNHWYGEKEAELFKHTIVKRPCKALVERITSALDPGKPDYELALNQHDDYIDALKHCGVDTLVLLADGRYPYSFFTEYPVVITSKCAIITNPGASSRNGEKLEIIHGIKKFFLMTKSSTSMNPAHWKAERKPTRPTAYESMIQLPFLMVSRR